MFKPGFGGWTSERGAIWQCHQKRLSYAGVKCIVSPIASECSSSSHR